MGSVVRRATEVAVIPTRFSQKEVERMERAQATLGLPSRSAFIRAAVLERVESVEQMKVVELRDVTEEEAMRLIDRYLKKHPGIHYTSDIADELGIDLPIAFAAAERLIERGRARVRGD